MKSITSLVAPKDARSHCLSAGGKRCLSYLCAGGVATGAEKSETSEHSGPLEQVCLINKDFVVHLGISKGTFDLLIVVSSAGTGVLPVSTSC